MSPERNGPHVPRRWSLRSTFGDLAFAGLLIAALSGIPLAVPFDIRNPFDSLAVILLTNPAAAFFRNVHYWSAQLFLVLTLAHAWDHLRRGTESRPRRGVWFHVAMSAPLAAFLMLSGFILKGDAEGQQAARILSGVLEQLPLVGRGISELLLGAEGNRQLLYVHHVATASILVWLFVAEHARGLWPRRVAVIESFLLVAAASLFLTPSLHDGVNPIVKGPWYFLGLQELLHWTSRPAIVLALGVALLALLVLLPRASDRWTRLSKVLLAGALAGYAVLTVAGVAFRGEAWQWGFAWSAQSSGLTAHGLARWWGPPVESLRQRPIPVVLDRREGCLFCHAGVKGLSASHSPESVGCASCHGGNPFSLEKGMAHARLVRVPGNLADAGQSCATARCHPGMASRVAASLMNSMAGVIAVDRAVFGEKATASPSVEGLGHEGADSHLRQLCASCHLGSAKAEWGPVHETSRGGGCNACHLNYSREARAELARYRAARNGGRSARTEAGPAVHPNLSLTIGSESCFGCHSRSGRISTSYEGWMETESADSGESVAAGESGRSGESVRPGESERPGQSGYPGQSKSRTLEDGRVFAFVQADIHAEKKMTCVDCHTSSEVMGKRDLALGGAPASRKHEAVFVTCEDCHFRGEARTVTVERLDDEARKIARLRGIAQPGRRFLVTARDPLLNTTLDANGIAWLTTKGQGQRLELRAPAPVCIEGGGHARLSCIACHGAWAPRCTGCHTRFDPARQAVDLVTGKVTSGEWVEQPSGFSAVPPTLGVRTVSPSPGLASQEGRLGPSMALKAGPSMALGASARALPPTIDTFIPGMVISLDRNQQPGSKPDNVFRRLYARAFSHTISKGARSCQSCHNDPVALGYGEGKLVFEVARANAPHRPRSGAAPGAYGEPGDSGCTGAPGHPTASWRFTPRYPAGPDGLPADAWTGFLQQRDAGASTRPDARPFSVDEQKRILTVGACLTCHEGTSAAMRSAVADWKGTLARISSRCVLPRW